MGSCCQPVSPGSRPSIRFSFACGFPIAFGGQSTRHWEGAGILLEFFGSIAKLPVDDAILDGEIICLDQNGVSQFNQLLNRKTEPVFYAFDLLWLNGEDLRQLPLIERKARLVKFVRSAKCDRLLFAQHIETRGGRFFQEICARDLEGIVAKRKHSIYKDGGNSWLKVKNPSYTQAEGRHELLTHHKK